MIRTVALGYAAGVLALQWQPALPGTLVPAVLAALLCAVLAAVLPWLVAAWPPSAAGRRALAASGLACAALAAALAGWSATAYRAAERLAVELPETWERRDIELIGVIAELPGRTERGLRFAFDVERVLTEGATVPPRILLGWYGRRALDEAAQSAPPSRPGRDGVRPGERWQLVVRLRRPHGSVNPHGFDYELWLLERDLRATGYVRRAVRRVDVWVPRPAYLVERSRDALRARIERTLSAGGQPLAHAGVIVALVVGDQRSIPQPQWQVYTRTGVNHLMSISGLHITMLAGLAFALVAALWRRTRLAERLPARRAAAAAGLAVAFGYAQIAGFAVPAQRTVCMLAVVAVALWLGRTGSATLILAWALLAVLLLDPWAVLSPSFWLSFGAIALILYVTAPQSGARSWWREWWQVQWAVTIGLIPALLALFQQVSLVSPLANAFAIPVVSLAVVPLALAGGLLPLDAPLWLAHLLMGWTHAALAGLAALPEAVWQQHAPPAWAIGVALAGVLWLLAPRGMPARWVGVVLLVPLFSAPLRVPAPGTAELTVFDVGHGLAVLVRTERHALLYDTGPGWSAAADAGNRILVPELRARGVRALDALIVTHDDLDHSGGAVSVLESTPVRWFGSSLPPGQRVLAHVDIAAAVPARCHAGQRWEWDGVGFEILHPTWESYLDPKMPDNERSCVLRVEAGGRAALLTADIGHASEFALWRRAAERLRADVLLVPHHGSRNSSAPEFVAAVEPRHALLSIGYRNRYGHPHPLIVERYRAAGALLHRTDQLGALEVRLASAGVEVRGWREIEPRYWRARPGRPEGPAAPP
jgi:competence protein ComEC